MIYKNIFIGFLFSFLAMVNSYSNRLYSQKSNIKEVLISAHRGGPNQNFPENALETFQNTLKNIPKVMLEMDIRSSKDGHLVLMHDGSLDRTTTLKGQLNERTLAELLQGFLVDKNGTVTKMKIPTLIQVFEWAANKNVFLSLDVKEKTIFQPIIDLVQKYNLKEKIEIITYSINDALLVHNYDPEINISMSIGSSEVLQKVLESKINPAKIAAFTGSALKELSFYNSLKESGIVVTLGTMGNLDNLAKTKGFSVFKKWKEFGINRFATDCPEEVYNSFK